MRHRATIVAALLAITFFLQAFPASLRHSLTWDEPSFIAAGHAYLSRGDFRFNMGHPPLMQELEAGFVRLIDPRQPTTTYEEYAREGNPAALFGRDLIFNSGNDARAVGLLARFPVALLGACLTFIVFRWGRRVFGPGPALIAATLCAFCPNLIAHAGVATEDLGCAALMVAATWRLWEADRRGGRWQWVLCGAVTGLAFSAKYTALLLVPSFGLIAAVSIFADRTRTNVVAWTRGLLTAAVVSLAVVAVPYGFRNGWGLYLEGLNHIYGDLPEAKTFYLNGRFSDSPWWYYAVASFVYKTAAPALMLIVAGVVSAVRDRAQRRDAAFILIPAAVVIIASMFDRANFGVRRILPAIPFLYLAAGVAWGATRGKHRRIAMALVGAFLLWTVAEAVMVYPNHLSYISAVFGGPSHGPELLGDSNVDWGQDLPALADWQANHGEANPILLRYFGTAVPSAYGVNEIPFPPLEVSGPQAPGTYAISVQLLLRLRKESLRYGPDLDWLTRYQPIGRAGYSINIYRFP